MKLNSGQGLERLGKTLIPSVMAKFHLELRIQIKHFMMDEFKSR